MPQAEPRSRSHGADDDEGGAPEHDGMYPIGLRRVGDWRCPDGRRNLFSDQILCDERLGICRA